MFSKNARVKYTTVLVLLVSVCSLMRVLDVEPKVQNENSEEINGEITLGSYEYYNVTVYVEKGQALSGDWEARPADVLSPPFLVFIVDSENFAEWAASDNFTQAISRIPGDKLLYLYDPLFKLDDIPGDMRRSGTFQVKVPYSDNWSLIMYSGASFALTFTWHLDVFDAIWLDLAIYISVGSISIAILSIVLTVFIRKKRKPTEDDEVQEILKIRDEIKKEEQQAEHALGSLEELDEDNEFKLEK